MLTKIRDGDVSMSTLDALNDAKVQHAIKFSCAFYSASALPSQQAEDTLETELAYPHEMVFVKDGGWPSTDLIHPVKDSGEPNLLLSLWDAIQIEDHQFLEAEHLEAAVLQQKDILERRQGEKKGTSEDVHDPDMPNWQDVRACYCIQVFLREAYWGNKNLPYYANLWQGVFNGPAFHAALRKIRSVDASKPPSIDDRQPLSSHSSPSEATGSPQAPLPASLPVDEHEDEILDHVRRNRVAIINGETGCGKSSRIPVFLLDDDPQNTMMVSQPHRIAARSLAARVRDSLPESKRASVGFRMGHGIREDSRSTRLWFVTTGYIVRLLANKPSYFDSHTHLIIDEVHERSVDTDILCLLCRRLLETNPTIRLILMSATLSVDIYKEYFDVDEPHIFVGARRYPVDTFYADKLNGKRNYITAIMKASNPGMPPKDDFCKAQLKIAVSLCVRVGDPHSPTGTGAILIFVPGMFEIESVMEEVRVCEERSDELRWGVYLKISVRR